MTNPTALFRFPFVAGLLLFAIAGASGCDNEVESTPIEAPISCTSNSDCDVGECVAYATGQSVCVTDSPQQVGPAGQPPPPPDLLQSPASNPRATQSGSDR